MRLLIKLAAVTVLCTASPVGAQETDSTAVSPPLDIVILPIVNYSERMEAHEVLLPRLHYRLEEVGLAFLTSEELRPFLRESRIRSRGWVGRNDAQAIAEHTGARYLLLGSWDVYRTEIDPEVGFSLRVLDLESLELVASVSRGKTGSDFTGFLGLGTVRDPVELADRVMKEAVKDLFPIEVSEKPKDEEDGVCRDLALIPMDNFSSTANAGDIVSNVLITELLRAGYRVVEPGFVREMGLERGVINRGGVDRLSAGGILHEIKSCRVITGEVETFATAPGSPLVSTPRVAFGVRVMLPREGTVGIMQDLEGAGDDTEWLFQQGRTHALIPVTIRAVRRFVDTLDD